jgi:hypothetical protein
VTSDVEDGQLILVHREAWRSRISMIVKVIVGAVVAEVYFIDSLLLIKSKRLHTIVIACLLAGVCGIS